LQKLCFMNENEEVSVYLIAKESLIWCKHRRHKFSWKFMAMILLDKNDIWREKIWHMVLSFKLLGWCEYCSRLLWLWLFETYNRPWNLCFFKDIATPWSSLT
jgi:hypothetical protein